MMKMQQVYIYHTYYNCARPRTLHPCAKLVSVVIFITCSVHFALSDDKLYRDRIIIN